MTSIDWCAKHAELVAIKEKIATGRAVKSARFGEDEVEYFKADPARLDQLIDEAARECATASGRPHRPRRRAIRF